MTSSNNPDIIELDATRGREQKDFSNVGQFAALASETPDPTRERVDGQIYEVEDEENLPEGAKSQRRIALSDGDEDVYFSVWTATSDEDRYTGLSDKSQLPEDKGMLFDWGEFGVRSLVMRDMDFSVDMLFLDDLGYVQDAYKDVEPSDKDAKSSVCQYALELPAGTVDKYEIDDSWRVYVEDEAKMTKETAEVVNVGKQEEDFAVEPIVPVDNVNEAPEDAVVRCSDSLGLYYVWSNDLLERLDKGEYDVSHLGTDGDPSSDADDLYEFLDELVDAGADVWQVRNGELRVWPGDKEDWAVHDPRYNVTGIPDEEVIEILESYEDVNFMMTPDVEKRSPDFDPGKNHVFGPAIDTEDNYYRLDPDEAFCEVESEVFHQFDEAEYDDLDRRCCPFCGHQLQEYDKVYHSAKHEEMELPTECRSCGSNTRMEGNFMCPECHPDVESDEDDYQLVENDHSSAPCVPDKNTEKTGFQYSDAGSEQSPEEVQAAVKRFREEASEGTKRETPLIDWLLDEGRVSYKMSEADAGLQMLPAENGAMCGNCEYLRQDNDGTFRCTKVRGPMSPEFYCRLHEQQEEEPIFSHRPEYEIELSKQEEIDVGKVQEELLRAFKKQVWPEDLEKAPTMWSSDDEVPDFVSRWVEDVIEYSDPMWEGTFDDVPVTEENKVHETVQDSLTQSQGWSTQSIANRLQSTFEWMSQDRAETIARQEVAAVLNKAREIAYRARGDADQLVFDWVGPDDLDTTDICEDIKSRINSEGGAVTLDKLKEILRDVAKDYEYGTPERIDQLIPHYQCRRTIVERDLEELQ